MRNKKEFYEHAKEKEQELDRALESSEKLGWKDGFAMLLSAFLVFVPITAGILLALSFFMLWLFGAL